MFDRLTDKARKVLALARKEATRFNHDFIGTEHILLGILLEPCVAATVLRNLGVKVDTIRTEIENRVQRGGFPFTTGQLPFTCDAKKSLELSIEEASNLNHNFIGTEHLLLGLLRVDDHVTGRVLRDLGVRIEDARDQVLQIVSGGGARSSARQQPRSPSWYQFAEARPCAVCGEWKHGAFRYLPRSRESFMPVCEQCAEGILAAWEPFLKDHFGIE